MLADLRRAHPELQIEVSLSNANEDLLRRDADVAAMRAGVGIGICQVPLAAGPPRMVRLLPRLSFELPVWVVMALRGRPPGGAPASTRTTHENLRASRCVSLVFDQLVKSLGRYIRS
jgi:DNA-binding transcriptional LysR family regulator